MIPLSIQDKFDKLDRVQELRTAIGQSFSDNHSSTGRSILLSVSDDGDSCCTQETVSEYINREPQPGIKVSPSWLIWNSIFF